ncbi:MAG: PhzF family phenazine biosynthesis protein [Armatimonadota bacterium]
MIEIALVDAFAHLPFTGNPAGVCLLDDPLDEVLMQNIAMEMNQAETAFCWPEGSGFRLRWFTPTVEVELCGHATLATAHRLFETSGATTFRFQTLSGELRVTRSEKEYHLEFPAFLVAPEGLPNDVPGLDNALFVGSTGLDWLVQLDTEKAVREFQPDLAAIASIGKRALMVTAPGSNGTDFVSRLFGPNVGIAEDPVTGSSHCALAPYWSKKIGKAEMLGYQASRRGGFVRCQWSGGDRVTLIGQAKTVLVGHLTI